MEIDERRFDQSSRVRIAVLETQMAAQSRQLDALVRSVEGIEKTLSEARGSWKAMMFMGGGAATLGALITEWFHWASK